ncbi:hypothetical protein EIN_132470 [Entamoeba invadens IP1]|uniref:DH domain-containing protein n=1 Tax=Entamoeba invadens IP1 TaxID=370355 RepID=A0A0A1UH07_ENTIV|nr:hypothetical protein EIN_132470 [Entamoeba invadens IP1]ELP94358.1 hypothetical protein EIN_132470 [Entamoeba invadens IP1]|eukprot:XP_004261129.1 hypothetical protein EIN_132470 [Entamoeba invadens IP1]
MCDKYALETLSEKETLLLHSLYDMLHDEERYHKAFDVLRSSLVKETFYNYLIKISPQLITDLFIENFHTAETLDLLCELSDTEPDFQCVEFSQHLINNDPVLPLFLANSISSKDKTIKDLSTDLLLILSEQSDFVNALEPTIKPLVDLIGSGSFAQTFTSSTILTNLLQPKATNVRVKFLHAKGISKVISLMKTRDPHNTNIAVSLIYQLLADGTTRREAYVKHLIDEGLFDAVVSVMEIVSNETRQRILKILFVMTSTGAVQQIIDGDIFLYLTEFIDSPDKLQSIELLYVIMIFQECSAVRGAIPKMRGIGLSSRLCELLSHMEKITVQILRAVLSTIFNLLLDEEMLVEFQFFGLEKTVCDLDKKVPEVTEVVSKIVNRMANYKFRNQMFNAMKATLQQHDTREIQKIHALVEIMEEKMKEPIENNSSLVEEGVSDGNTIENAIQSVVKDILPELQPTENDIKEKNEIKEDVIGQEDVTQKEDEKVEMPLKESQTQISPRPVTIGPLHKEKVEDQRFTKDDQSDFLKVENVPPKKKSFSLNVGGSKKQAPKDMKEDEVVLDLSFTPRLYKRSGVRFKQNEISMLMEEERKTFAEVGESLEKFKERQTINTTRLSGSRNEKKNGFIQVQPPKTFKDNSSDSDDATKERSEHTQNNLKGSDKQQNDNNLTQITPQNTLIVPQKVESNKLTNSTDTQRPRQNTVVEPQKITEEKMDIKVSFDIPKFKYLCDGSTNLNEDQAKMIADLNLKKAKRKHIIMELLDTENSYVKQMKECLEEMYVPLKDLMSPEELAIAFNCFPQVYCINKDFNEKIQKRRGEDSDVSAMVVSDLFIDFFNNAEVAKWYGQYIVMGDSAVEYPFELKEGKIKELVSQWAYNCKIPANYLIQPVQRFPRYVLLLDSLIKATPNFTNEYGQLQKALELVKHVTKVIDDKKSAYISHQKTLLYTPYLPSKENLGEYIYDGVVTMKATLRFSSTVALFSQMVLVFVEKKNALTLKWMCKKEDVSYVTKEKNEKYFIILNFKNTKTTVTMFFHSEIEYIGWKKNFLVFGPVVV